MLPPMPPSWRVGQRWGCAKLKLLLPAELEVAGGRAEGIVGGREASVWHWVL